MSDKLNSDENKRILREITHLSSLNHQYIVRYFQTWIEYETDQNVIKDFEEWDDEEYDDEYDDESEYEMRTQVIDDDDIKARVMQQQRSSSLGKGLH